MQQRGKRDRIEQADSEFHHPVQQGFAHLAKTEPKRFVQINGQGTELEVADRIEAVLHRSLVRWYNIEVS
jgi:thymidylate kinase